MKQPNKIVLTTGVCSTIVVVVLLVLFVHYCIKHRKALKYIITSSDNAMEHAQGYGNTRGYRNNNPLNLRISSNNWLGKVPASKNTDGAFEQFITMAYGFRAAMKNIRTLVDKRGCKTVQELINKWAPASDGNNPQRYAVRVCNTAGCQTDSPIKTHNREFMCKLAYAMAEVENGTYPNWTDVYAGYDLL